MSESRDLAEMHVKAFNERRWERATGIYAPDLVMVEPGGTANGIDAYLAVAKGFVAAFPDCRMDVTVVIASGDRVAIEGVYSGTHTGTLVTPQGEVPPTGKTLSLPLCDVFEVQAGRIASVRAYYDQTTFGAQLGLLPASGPSK